MHSEWDSPMCGKSESALYDWLRRIQLPQLFSSVYSGALAHRLYGGYPLNIDFHGLHAFLESVHYLPPVLSEAQNFIRTPFLLCLDI